MKCFFATIGLNEFIAFWCKVFILCAIVIVFFTKTGLSQTIFTEDWESGIGSWFADNGVWEVGIPTAGPSNTHSGVNCAGTILNGNYPSNANTRLISPSITLPTPSGGETIQLKFWQWFIIQNSLDQGVLQISDSSGAWETISSVDFDGTNTGWTQYVADLTSYAGSSVRIGFYFTSNSDGTVYNGWYIDDISIEMGVINFPNPEDFEIGIGDWSADNGLWEVGVPTAGPTSTHSGTNCAGTRLDGDYPSYANTRLISPEVTLTPITGQTPMLFFYQWFIIQDNLDKGLIQISTNGGEWQTVSNPITGTNNTWSQFGLDLSAYSDSTVRIAFYFTSNSDGTTYSGWYIDDIRIEGIVSTTAIFTPFTITTDADSATSVYAIDVDGDGDMDVLSASSGDNKIAWYENDGNENHGNENFTPHTITTDALAASSVYALDVDGDGDIDVLSASSGDNKIEWYQNRGVQDFTPHIITTSALSSTSVYAEDINGDEDIDVLSASFNDDKIAWYENDGNENFTPHTITTDADGARSVYAIDVDGDGDIDVLSASQLDDKIAWYENDGNGNFTPHDITTSAFDAWSVYAIDVDGDGDIDVLSASSGDNKIAWYENDGDENFTPITITTGANGANSVYAIDVDGDGDIDVLSASVFDDKIALYLNDGFENFILSTITTDADGANSVYAVDVDGDGDIDVLSASSIDDKIAWYENQIIVDIVNNDPPVVPVKTLLYNNYPNPFNPSTTIYYALPEAVSVELIVYDVLGREVAKLVNEEKPAGSYEVEFDGSGLTSGIYFYRLRAGNFVETKKMVLMK